VCVSVCLCICSCLLLGMVNGCTYGWECVRVFKNKKPKRAKSHAGEITSIMSKGKHSTWPTASLAPIALGSRHVKLLLVGDSGVGKTTFRNQFMDRKFSDESLTTIGIDYKQKKLQVDTETVTVQVWYGLLF
jgi:hypothetical protein